MDNDPVLLLFCKLMHLQEDKYALGTFEAVLSLYFTLQKEPLKRGNSKDLGKTLTLMEILSADSTLKLDVGSLVIHSVRGPGTVKAIDESDMRGKPVVVAYDNGEVHHYSLSSAAKLRVTSSDVLLPIKRAMDIVGTVMLDVASKQGILEQLAVRSVCNQAPTLFSRSWFMF